MYLLFCIYIGIIILIHPKYLQESFLINYISC